MILASRQSSILAIDPGKKKCGLAVMEPSGQVKIKRVVDRAKVIEDISAQTLAFDITEIVIGNTAFGKQLIQELSTAKKEITIHFVSEKNSSLEARQRYWQDNPPKGFWKFVPTTLRLPPRPIDDYAAVILGERHLKH